MRRFAARSFVLTVAAAGLAALGASPAMADVCNNDTSDINFTVYPYRIGIDDPLSGYTGVVAVCLQNAQTGQYYLATGAGVWVHTHPDGSLALDLMQCNSQACWVVLPII